jgi:hypothetical protein
MPIFSNLTKYFLSGSKTSLDGFNPDGTKQPDSIVIEFHPSESLKGNPIPKLGYPKAIQPEQWHFLSKGSITSSICPRCEKPHIKICQQSATAEKKKKIPKSEASLILVDWNT